MAVFTVSASIGTTSDHSSISSWNTSLSGYDFVTLTNNPAWVLSTVYAVGDLVKNDTPERLYICTVGGTSAGSGGPTGVSTGIVDGGVTWDFVCATSGNKVIYEGLLKNESHTSNLTMTLGSGVTMDSAGYAILKCAPGGSFIDNGTKVAYDETKGAHIHSAVHNSKVFTVSANFHIFGVQFKVTASTKDLITTTGKFYRNICHTESTKASNTIRVNGGQVVNNLVQSGINSTHDNIGISYGQSGLKVAFNTALRPANATKNAGAGSAHYGVSGGALNCAFFGYNDSLAKGGGGTLTTAHYDWSVSDDIGTNFPALTGGSYSATYTQTTPFVDAHNIDYSAVSGGSLDGNGIDLSADTANYISADVDIFGTVRANPPTIGCFEIVANAITLSLPTQTSITQTSATVGSTTDTAGGILYAYVKTGTNPTPPTAAEMVSGSGAAFSANLVPVLGINTFPATGLLAGTDYHTFFYQVNGVDDSNILDSGVWATTTSGIVPLRRRIQARAA